MKRLFLGIMLMLVGCNSFNRTFIIHDNAPSKRGEKVDTFTITTDTSSPLMAGQSKPIVVTKIVYRNGKPVKNVCPKIDIPLAEKVPALPLEALHALRPSEHDKADAITLQHVKDLRAYIQRMNKRNEELRASYAMSCAAYQKANP